MSISSFLILFSVGIFIGASSWMLYVIVSGRLDTKDTHPIKKVRHTSPKLDEPIELDHEQESRRELKVS